MKKKLLVMVLGLVMAFAMCACSSSSDSSSDDHSQIEVDTAKQTVSVYGEVNGKYFTEVTRHGVVFKDGANGEKAIIRALGSEKEFYGALVSLGIDPSDNMPVKDQCAQGTIVEGPQLDVTISWDGQDPIPFEQCIKTGDGSEYKIDCRFGGNIKKAYKLNTGCIFCLDSCPVGITSNANYGWGAIETAKTVQCYGNDEVLPEDVTLVKVTFTVTGK